jgi:hypothetical protein
MVLVVKVVLAAVAGLAAQQMVSLVRLDGQQ